MKIKKFAHKISVGIIITAFIASNIVPTTVMAKSSSFSDVPTGIWYEDAVNYLADKNILEGPGDGKFYPTGTLDRAQSAQVIFKALDLPTGEATDFTDLTKDWYKAAVGAVITAGIFDEKGTGNDKFSPNADLTRAQAAKVIVDAYKLSGEADLSPFPDVVTIPDWALVERNYLAIAVQNGVINGKKAADKTTLSPNDNISRAEFATMIMRAIDSDNNIKEAIVSAESAIAALGEELTLEDEEAVENARALVESALSLDGKATIKGLDVLKASEAKIEELKQVAKDELIAAINEAENAIESLPSIENLAFEDEEAVENARAKVNAILKIDSEVKINGIELLVSAEEKITEILNNIENAQIEELEDITVILNSDINDVKLPSQLKVTFQEGTIENFGVDWDLTTLDLSKLGEYIIEGEIGKYELKTSINIIVQKEYPDSVTLDKSSVTLKEGQSTQLEATTNPTNTVNNGILWTLNDPAIASVDEDGQVTAHSEGTTDIIVTTENGKSASTQIIVSNRPNLSTNAYASVTINNLAKSISMSIQNLDSTKVTVDKIEVYETDKLVTSYSESDLSSSGISTEILPEDNWGISIDFKLGIWKDDSYVKFYIKSNDRVYEYQSDL